MRSARGLAGLAVVTVLLTSACGSNLTTEEIAVANGQAQADRTPATSAGPSQESAATGTGPEASAEAAVQATTPTGGQAIAPAAGQAGPAGARPASTGGPRAAGKDTTGGSAGGSPAPAGSGGPIVLGNVGTYSGPVGASLAGTRDGLLAWAQHTNAKGGINGRPVDVRVADDGNDPARTLSLVKDMVERQHVVAIVGMFSVMSTSSVRSYIESSGVPVVGGDLIDAAWTESPSFFPQGSPFEIVAMALAKLGVDGGTKNIGIVYCAETQLCSLGARLVTQGAERYGARVVYTAQITITAPDYTAQCLGAQSKGVDFMVIGADANTIGRVATSCARQGFEPRYSAASISITAALEGQAQLEGLVSAQAVFPWMATGTPAVAEFGQALRTYAPGAVPAAATAAAWTSGKLLAAAASRVRGDVTPASLIAALNTIRDDNLGGLTLPLSFGGAKGHPQPNCYFPIQIVNRAFTAPKGTTPVCV